jgi:hypothetical protein
LESPGSVIPEEDAEHLRDVAEAVSVLASPVSAERKALEQLEAREALLARAKVLSINVSILFGCVLLEGLTSPWRAQTLKEQEAAATAALEVVKQPAKKTRSVCGSLLSLCVCV